MLPGATRACPQSPEDLKQMQAVAAAMGGAPGAAPAPGEAPPPAAMAAAMAAAGGGGGRGADAAAMAQMQAALAGGVGPDGQPSADAMMAMASNPAMIEASMKMLRGMDEDTVVKVGGPGGEGIVRETGGRAWMYGGEGGGWAAHRVAPGRRSEVIVQGAPCRAGETQ
jgi:hypothetical protein